ncbi:hypothetical protein ACOSQ4_032021 [Xanthoceras sorbifolium]
MAFNFLRCHNTRKALQKEKGYYHLDSTKRISALEARCSWFRTGNQLLKSERFLVRFSRSSILFGSFAY